MLKFSRHGVFRDENRCVALKEGYSDPAMTRGCPYRGKEIEDECSLFRRAVGGFLDLGMSRDCPYLETEGNFPFLELVGSSPDLAMTLDCSYLGTDSHSYLGAGGPYLGRDSSYREADGNFLCLETV